MIAALLQLMHGHQYTAFPAITMATDQFSATHPPSPQKPHAGSTYPPETPYQPGAITDGWIRLLLIRANLMQKLSLTLASRIYLLKQVNLYLQLFINS